MYKARRARDGKIVAIKTMLQLRRHFRVLRHWFEIEIAQHLLSWLSSFKVTRISVREHRFQHDHWSSPSRFSCISYCVRDSCIRVFRSRLRSASIRTGTQ